MIGEGVALNNVLVTFNAIYTALNFGGLIYLLLYR